MRGLPACSCAKALPTPHTDHLLAFFNSGSSSNLLAFLFLKNSAEDRWKGRVESRARCLSGNTKALRRKTEEGRWRRFFQSV